MKYALGVVLALVVVLLVVRLTRKEDTAMKDNAPVTATTVHKTKILEVIQGNSYTYLKVKEKKNEYWVATIKDDAKVGGEYTYSDGLEMTNFTSKELNRTFPTILFVNEESSAGMVQPEESAPMGMEKPVAEQTTVELIAQSAGGVSIGELYKNRAKYANQKIKVKGKVVKVNNDIMDRNWVHLQDGTNDSGNFDLTVTTIEMLKVGDVAEFEGTFVLDKDFGAGYVYEVILEGGELVK